jgi:SPP1 family predicted phage head-tail adaptor
MRAGSLKHRIVFEKPTITQDSMGGMVTSWATHATVWGEVIHLAGREYWQAQQANSEATGKIRIRYRNDITPLMRVSFEGKVLQILTVYPFDSRRTELCMLFKEALD